MKALMLKDLAKVEVLERDVPQPGPGELLVHIHACGICGSDMHAYHGDPGRKPPFILGHEAAGVIAAGPRVGERVAINPLVGCDRCDYCIAGQPQLCFQRDVMSSGRGRAGVLSEYAVCPERNVYPLPDGLTFERAALAEPIAVGYHAVLHGMRLMRRPVSVSRVCVIGGGAVGLGTALSLALQGATCIHLAEPHPARRAEASRIPAVEAFAPDGEDHPSPASMDLIIDCVASPTTRTMACKLARRGAVIVQVGVLPDPNGIDLRQVTMDELIFTGTYCYTPVEFGEVLRAMADGSMGPLDWFELRPMSEAVRAFDDLDRGAAKATKIVLLPAQ